MALASSLGEEIGYKPSILNIYEFDSMKDEIIFECSSTLYVVALSTANDLAKTAKEAKLDFNPKGKSKVEGEGEGDDYSFKEGPSSVSL